MRVGFTLDGLAVEWEMHPGATFFESLQGEGHYASKRGCSTGDCGVCIVMMNGENVHACQIFSPAVEGQDIRTYEGVVYRDKKTGEVKTKPGRKAPDA